VRFIDEHTVASGGSEGAVHLWDTRQPNHGRRLGSHAAAIPDGHLTAWRLR
jgi:hypothetical protein